jgi:hypothetical protein
VISPVATQRVLQGVAATVSVTFADQEGTSTSAGGAVTVDIAKADGSVVATARTTTGTGPYVATLSAAETASLNVLTCTWKDGATARATTTVEVVGGYYFSAADAVAFDASLKSGTEYPDEKILAVRREVEDECERITGVAWVPRFRRVRLDGIGYPNADTAGFPLLPTGSTRTLRLKMPDSVVRAVRSVRLANDASTYTALTNTELAAIECTVTGELIRRDFGSFPWGVQNVTVEYEHGHDAPPPDLRHACLTRLRSRLNLENSGVSDRATQFVQQGGGIVTLAQPGRAGFETGLPEVDAVYQRYSMRLPGQA